MEELITNKKNGFVFENKEEVIAFLNSLDFSDIFLSEVAKNGHQTIVENFNVNKTMQEYLIIWQKMIKEKNNEK